MLVSWLEHILVYEAALHTTNCVQFYYEPASIGPPLCSDASKAMSLHPTYGTRIHRMHSSSLWYINLSYSLLLNVLNLEIMIVCYYYDWNVIKNW
jgi:hypothetical protein